MSRGSVESSKPLPTFSKPFPNIFVATFGDINGLAAKKVSNCSPAARFGVV
jgi:hypothetical protein